MLISIGLASQIASLYDAKSHMQTIAILKINGEKLLQIQDDGGFIQYVIDRCLLPTPTHCVL